MYIDCETAFSYLWIVTRIQSLYDRLDRCDDQGTKIARSKASSLLSTLKCYQSSNARVYIHGEPTKASSMIICSSLRTSYCSEAPLRRISHVQHVEAALAICSAGRRFACRHPSLSRIAFPAYCEQAKPSFPAMEILLTLPKLSFVNPLSIETSVRQLCTLLIQIRLSMTVDQEVRDIPTVQPRAPRRRKLPRRIHPIEFVANEEESCEQLPVPAFSEAGSEEFATAITLLMTRSATAS